MSNQTTTTVQRTSIVSQVLWLNCSHHLSSLPNNIIFRHKNGSFSWLWLRTKTNPFEEPFQGCQVQIIKRPNLAICWKNRPQKMLFWSLYKIVQRWPKHFITGMANSFQKGQMATLCYFTSAEHSPGDCHKNRRFFLNDYVYLF